MNGKVDRTARWLSAHGEHALAAMLQRWLDKHEDDEEEMDDLHELIIRTGELSREVSACRERTEELALKIVEIEETITRSWSTPWGWIDVAGTRLAKWIAGGLIGVCGFIVTGVGILTWDSHERLVRVEAFSMTGPRAAAEDVLLVVLAHLEECAREDAVHVDDPAHHCSERTVGDLRRLADSLRNRIEKAHAVIR